MKSIYIISIALAFALLSCNNPEERKTVELEKKQIKKPLTITPSKTISINLNDSTTEMLLRKGKALTTKMQITFQSEVLKAIRRGDMLTAIGFCNEKAMVISDSASYAEQAVIRRLALKNRNPENRMNDQETRIYKDFVLSWISNVPMKPKIQISADNNPVYYAPITMKPLCLNCHGSLEKDINPNIAAKIKELYPQDKAIDFKAVDMRGMWSITFSEYYIN